MSQYIPAGHTGGGGGGGWALLTADDPNCTNTAAPTEPTSVSAAAPRRTPAMMTLPYCRARQYRQLATHNSPGDRVRRHC